jgi:hydrogenase nickel incorporation protein HypA/HybF
MHEFSIVSSLIKIIEGHAADNNAVRVLKVEVELGEFSGVEPELFAGVFETFASCGGLIGGARLVMDIVATKILCRGCGEKSPLTDAAFYCLACGSADVDVVEGNDIVLRSLEMESD